MKRIGKNSGIPSINNINQNRTMITNRFLKTLALPVAVALGMFTASCSNDDNILDEQQPSAAKYEIPVTVSATRSGDDASTRAVYDSDTRKLTFEEGDQLFIQGTDDTAGTFAGLLSNTAGAPGTFSGTLTTTNEYTGTFEALFTSATTLTATLLPKDYGTEAAGYLTLSGSGASQTLTVDATKAFVTAASADAAKKLAIEQLSLEQATAYSTGFALAPVNAVLNYSIAANSLSAGTHTMFVHNGNGISISGSITAVTDAATTFAVALPADASTSRNYSLCTLGYNDIVKTGKALTEGKVFNISATASENANAPLPGAFTVGDGKQVRFAKGNLTYSASSPNWSFLSNSWDYNTSPSAYGKSNGSQHFDWGTVFKSGTSGESDLLDEMTTNTNLGSGWSGLSRAQWRYLLGYDGQNSGTQSSKRTVSWHHYAKITSTATIGTENKRYLLIFPDDFQESDWNTTSMGATPTAFDGTSESSAEYTADNFTAMQAVGIVILPAAGCHLSSYWHYVGDCGYYWSSTSSDASNTYILSFGSDFVDMSNFPKASYYFPVRLVQNLN